MVMADVIIPPKKRIESIDVLRGIVMVIMVLDHTRDFFTNIRYNPTDLSKASTALFLTRFITHYCAALFVFLAGTGAFLSISRGKSKGEASRFLLSRGVWIIILELTFVNWGFSINRGAWQFSMDYSFFFLQVFWVIGLSMIILAGLIYLPVEIVGAVGLLLIFGHDAFDKISAQTGGVLWQFIHVQGIVNYASNTRHIFVLYPLVPWVGVMAAGYSFGAIFKMDAAKRKKILLIIGVSALAIFVLIRSFNIYGDPDGWKDQGVWYRTVLSFINAQKYPPSLDYLLITIGPGMLALAALEHAKSKVTDFFLIFGRVPLFYYLLHIWLLQAIAAVVFNVFTNKDHDFSLPWVYLFWALAVFILYFPCKWFMKYKMTHKHWWLSYM